MQLLVSSWEYRDTMMACQVGTVVCGMQDGKPPAARDLFAAAPLGIPPNPHHPQGFQQPDLGRGVQQAPFPLVSPPERGFSVGGPPYGNGSFPQVRSLPVTSVLDHRMYRGRLPG